MPDLNILKTPAPLVVFAILGTLLVGITHYFTQDTIRHNENQALLYRLNALLPEHAYDNNIIEDSYLLDGEPFNSRDSVRIYPARMNEKPVAALFSLSAPGGYNGPIQILVGIEYQTEKLLGVRILKHRETPGLGDKIELRRSDWVLNFFDRSLGNPAAGKWYVKKDGGEFDQFTGATITPRAVVGAVRQVLIYFSTHKQEFFKRTRQEPAPSL